MVMLKEKVPQLSSSANSETFDQGMLQIYHIECLLLFCYKSIYNDRLHMVLQQFGLFQGKEKIEFVAYITNESRQQENSEGL